MAIAWPISTLPFQSMGFNRKNLSRSGGLTITGVEQVVQSSTDFWEARASVKIRKPTQVLAYRALQAQQWGRAAEWILPACPNPLVPAEPPPADYSWSDDWSEDFSIGPAPPIIPPGEGALVTVDADAGDRTLTFVFIDPTFTPQAGMFFSIGNRLYMIGTIGLVGTRTYTATFSPGLRVSAAIDDAVEFSSPRCLMRLTADNIGNMDLDMLRFSDITLSFVEVPV